MIKTSRLNRELAVLTTKPPPGVSCFPKNDDNCDVLNASIIGLQNTPYESGVFKLEMTIPDKYPFEPPQVRFKTPVYHPNIDDAGRICLDLLRLPPKGSWRATRTLSNVLMSIQLLLAEPNPDDPLMADIADEYRFNRAEYIRKAAECTKKYAFQNAESLEKQVSNLDDVDENILEPVRVNKRKMNNELSSESDSRQKILKLI